MPRIAGYVRVSTQKQADEDSHVRQRETIEKWAEESLDGDYEITFFEDIAESGQNLSRDSYDRMMDKLHQFDIVVVRELSRFGRNLQKMLNDIEIVEENNCDFVSIRDDHMDTTSAQGKLMFHIVVAFNQFWADIARERQEELIQRRREEGKSIGRPKKLTDKRIKRLFEMWVDNDHSYKTLAAICQSNGWVDSITRQTTRDYMLGVKKGNLEVGVSDDYIRRAREEK